MVGAAAWRAAARDNCAYSFPCRRSYSLHFAAYACRRGQLTAGIPPTKPLLAGPAAVLRQRSLEEQMGFGRLGDGRFVNAVHEQ
jgi:hypothetical protein